MTTIIRSAITIDGRKPNGQDFSYTLLSLWEDDIPADISATGTDEEWIAEGYNDWPVGLSDRLVIQLRTTTALTNRVIVTKGSGQDHNGISVIDGGGGFAFTSNLMNTFVTKCENVIVKEIEIMSTYTSSEVVRFLSVSSGLLENNIIIANSISSGKAAIIDNSLADNIVVLNNIVKTSGRGIDSRNGSGWLVCGNVVVTTDSYGLLANSNTQVYNNIVVGASVIDYYGTDPINSSNNASSDSSAYGSGSVYNITDSEFVDAIGGDYHLVLNSQLIGIGKNLVEDAVLDSPKYDIDGDQLPDTGAWDMGFDFLPISDGITVILTPATESNQAKSLSLQKNLTLNKAIESNSAHQAILQKNITVNPAIEIDLSSNLSVSKMVQLTTAIETNNAEQLSLHQIKTLTAAIETDQAIAIEHLKITQLNAAQEVDQALSTFILSGIALNPATENNQAKPLDVSKRITISRAQETDSAESIALGNVIQVIQASETDQAKALTHSKRYTLSPASEINVSMTLATTQIVELIAAIETDQALMITLPGGKVYLICDYGLLTSVEKSGLLTSVCTH